MLLHPLALLAQLRNLSVQLVATRVGSSHTADERPAAIRRPQPRPVDARHAAVAWAQALAPRLARGARKRPRGDLASRARWKPAD